MITLDKAYQLINFVLGKMRLPTEKISVHDALNRIVTEDQLSLLDLPPFHKSAMDGYSIIAKDKHDKYKLIETVAAGEIPKKKLTAGTAIKVMTGSPVPQAARQVIPVENTSCIGNMVYVNKYDKKRHICNRGEDVGCGNKIVPASAKLNPLAIANLIACGISAVNVYQRPHVAIISTGNEIVDTIEQITPGKIMNSNGPMLKALCDKFNYKVTGYYTVPDGIGRTVAILKSALSNADIVILSGGVSMGDFDYVKNAIKKLEFKLHFDKVAIKPGKPTVFASNQKQQLVFALPGNPVSAYLTFYLFVVRAIDLMSGKLQPIKNILLPLHKNFSRTGAKRLEFVPCYRLQNGSVAAIEFHGSAHLAALLKADGFFKVPIDVNEIRMGTMVEFIECN